jgi:hypothetical protein
MKGINCFQKDLGSDRLSSISINLPFIKSSGSIDYSLIGWKKISIRYKKKAAFLRPLWEHPGLYHGPSRLKAG